MNPIKYVFLFGTYAWLRIDPVLWLTFRGDWKARYEFMASLYGEEDTTKFLEHRVKLVKARNKPLTPIILPSRIGREIDTFFRQDVKTKKGREQRLEIINRFIFWCTDPDINSVNIDSYRTRISIIEALFNQMFQNSLSDESDIIMDSIEPIVFSRTTHAGTKGESSPLVHNVIIKSVGRLLMSHFHEVKRLRHASLDKLTQVKLIKEIQKSKKSGGSLAFSADMRKRDEFQHKFPLPENQVKTLKHILKRYSFSAWPDSREHASELISSLEKDFGFDIN